jgi:type II secretory pathway component PulJ
MSRRAGLTLLDLLVAMALLAIILATVYAVFANHQRSVEAASEKRDVYAQGRLVLDRLARDLTGAWLPETAPAQGGRGPAFLGQSNRLDFVSSGQLSSEQAAGEDLAEIGYRTEENDNQKGQRLIRRQDRTVDGDVTAGGDEIVLTRHLSSVTFAYLSPTGEEVPSWEGTQFGQLPVAVRIELVLFVDENRTETFTTLVSLPLAWPMVKRAKQGTGIGVMF